MPNYRRSFVPGGTYFFTIVAEGRANILCSPAMRTALRQAITDCRNRWPFDIDATVLLPDHLHAIWTLPPDDDSYSKRWGWIKKEATKTWLALGGEEQPVSASRSKRRRRGVFQRGFWEHTLRDEEEYRRLLEYIHYNPVKHGLVESPIDWPYSTLRKMVKAGIYSMDWGSPDVRAKARLNFDDLTNLVGE